MVVSAEMEKRSFIRMMVDSPVQVRFANIESHGRCHDLSASGMGIMFKETQLQLGDKVALELKPGRPGVLALQAEGHVVHLQPDPEGILVGVEFSKVD
ncbi:PilZ domain-containing protein [Celerinatantimonas sp. MCCC 1A17872]|uniref:PilZ domain-containing protein n=1 Tax=Celerinatantimonas sp. MCCC 1A17872 TaxID=3177514 RepID=UPI0038C1558F